MTEEEKDDLLHDIHRALKGDGLSKQKGLIEVVEELRSNVNSFEEQLRKYQDQLFKYRNILIGVGVGVLIGGVIFGFVSAESVMKLLKNLK